MPRWRKNGVENEYNTHLKKSISLQFIANSGVTTVRLHRCFLIRIVTRTVLFDPLWTEHLSPEEFHLMLQKWYHFYQQRKNKDWLPVMRANYCFVYATPSRIISGTKYEYHTFPNPYEFLNVCLSPAITMSSSHLNSPE